MLAMLFFLFFPKVLQVVAMFLLFLLRFCLDMAVFFCFSLGFVSFGCAFVAFP